MTADRWAELEALAKDATPGPWFGEWQEGDDWWSILGQPIGEMVCPEVATCTDDDDARYIAAANPQTVLDLLDELRTWQDTANEDVPALVAEIERLTGEPTEDEIGRAGDVLATHGYRVTSDWYPTCVCGWRADHAHDAASFDRHVARVALRAARGLS